MPLLVVATASLRCSMGTSPASLSVIRPTIQAGGKAVANIQDSRPVANIPSLGMCNATANPAVAAATAAALGVHTPAACSPATGSPWTPGARKVTVQGAAALHASCTLSCQWGGVITVGSAGQGKVEVS